MLGSITSSHLIPPLLPQEQLFLMNSIWMLNGRVQVLCWLCWSTICSQINCMYISGETMLMKAIFWGSESCDCKKDEYQRQHSLISNTKHYCEITSLCHLPALGSGFGCTKIIPQSWAAVSASLTVSHWCAQRSLKLQELTILGVKSHSMLNAPLYLQVLVGTPANALAESERTLQSFRGDWEHLEVPTSTGAVAWCVWVDRGFILDEFTFCWCIVTQITTQDIDKLW
jgi:hypothetical protein